MQARVEAIEACQRVETRKNIRHKEGAPDLCGWRDAHVLGLVSPGAI